jgi:hypothetical protein
LSFTKERNPHSKLLNEFRLVLTLVLPSQTPTQAPTQII